MLFGNPSLFTRIAIGKGVARFVKSGDGPRFLWLRVMVGEPTKFKRNMNPAECRVMFRAAYLGG